MTTGTKLFSNFFEDRLAYLAILSISASLSFNKNGGLIPN